MKSGDKPGSIEKYEKIVSAVSLASIILCFFLKNSGILFWYLLFLTIINMGMIIFSAFKRESMPFNYIFLNIIQAAIFFKLFILLNHIPGAGHFSFEKTPVISDWIGYTFFHVFNAIDLLDIKDLFSSIDNSGLNHNTSFSCIVLMAMYVQINLVIFKILFNYVNKHALQVQGKGGLKLLRFCGLIISIGIISVFAWKNHWQLKKYILWYMENIIFTIDTADISRIFKLVPAPGKTEPIIAGISLFFRIIIFSYFFGLANRIYLFLVKKGRPVHELARMCSLREYSIEERILAIEILGKRGRSASSAIPDLIKNLAETSNKLRYAASDALEKIDPHWAENETAEKAVPALIKAMKSSDKSVSMSAVKTLGRLGDTAQNAVLGLISMLSNEHMDIRSLAAESIVNIGSGAIPMIIRAMTRENDNIDTMISILNEIDPEWQDKEESSGEIRRIAEIMVNKTGAEQTACARALEKIEPVSGELVSYLVKALKDNTVRNSAIKALGHIGENAGQALDKLIFTLADNDKEIRSLAYEALGKIDPGWQGSETALKAAGELIKSLPKGAESGFEQPQKALIAIGTAAIPKLIKALVNTDKNLQKKAGITLKKINPEWAKTEEAASMVPWLSKALTHENWYIKVSAANVLEQMGGNAIKASAFLVRGLADSNRDVKAAFKKALDRVMVKNEALLKNNNTVPEEPESIWPKIETDREDAAKIINDLEQKNVSLRLEALKALSGIEPPAPEAVPHLLILLADSSRDVRMEAFTALEYSDKEWKNNKYLGEIVPLFVKALSEPDTGSPYALPSEALKAMGQGTIEYLLPLLADKNKAVANTAAPILEEISTQWHKSKGAQKAVPVLAKKLAAEEWYVKNAAAQALGKIGPGAVKAVPGLVAGLSDKNKAVRESFKAAMDKILLKK